MVDLVIATEEIELMTRERSRPPNDNGCGPEPFEADESGPAVARNRRHRAPRDSQERLGANAEHKTEMMRKRHRGNFP